MKRLQKHEIVDGGHWVYRKVSWSSSYHPNKELYRDPSRECTQETYDSGLLILTNGQVGAKKIPPFIGGGFNWVKEDNT